MSTARWTSEPGRLGGRDVPGPRRRSAQAPSATDLNYAAVGVTASDVVLSYPPAGFRASEHRHRIGSGARRFDVAGRSLMTWGVMRGAGVRVEDVQAEPTTTVDPYTGTWSGALFLEDGTPWITPGMTSNLVLMERPVEVRAPVKVVSVTDEPGRIGFTYGSCPGHPAQMEQLLVLEHTDDDAVWLTMRTVWRATSLTWRVPAAAYALADKRIRRRLLTALHPCHAA